MPIKKVVIECFLRDSDSFFEQVLNVKMHGLASAILLALFPLSAFGIFTPPGHIVLEKRGTASSWIQTNRLDPRTVVPVRIGLTGSNLDREHEFLLDVYVGLFTLKNAAYSCSALTPYPRIMASIGQQNR